MTSPSPDYCLLPPVSRPRLDTSRSPTILYAMDSQLLQQRIAQWEKMTQDDPDNAMGWFSLGGAYKEGERPEEAARCFRKAIELDEGLSRAYQLLGGLLIKQDAAEQAAEVLTKGYTIAAERGDVMPMKAMGSLLENLGKPLPEVASDKKELPVGEGEVMDRRTAQPGPRLPSPPLKGAIGKFIYDHYSAPTWREWIGQGTKVINELRLDLSQEHHQQAYDIHMMEWLGFTQQEVDDYAADSDG
ncbi:MAG: tetratricopeptide repeat protein [Phycisphaera sp.]|nr:tetratricopeptide repeat protein [Phycisphaera sp.]